MNIGKPVGKNAKYGLRVCGCVLLRYLVVALTFRA